MLLVSWGLASERFYSKRRRLTLVLTKSFVCVEIPNDTLLRRDFYDSRKGTEGEGRCPLTGVTPGEVLRFRFTRVLGKENTPRRW